MDPSCHEMTRKHVGLETESVLPWLEIIRAGSTKKRVALVNCRQLSIWRGVRLHWHRQMPIGAVALGGLKTEAEKAYSATQAVGRRALAMQADVPQ
jgi:hypothetical protein